MATRTPGVCAPGQVRVTTTTSGDSYGPGSPVTATSVLALVDGPPCIMRLTSSGSISCGVQLSFDDSGGTAQYWPWPGEQVPCPATGTVELSPGDTETATQTWNQQAMGANGHVTTVPPGTYCATGEWSWASGSGAPDVAVGRSAPFSIG